ncbi:unnamed protein product [Acanthoscelides obtectus]|uniref:Transposase n=1 Tax=Acanthoscelides obtectus TaxID=200917 RepID=A0A9P0P0S8_ACAOB|nr:unnamed protein product [Acanthoscelides obtectus]CAK1669741.1 hypothetical protein AOBTE_LOCUS27218 [Acanthoscelides obtectus]
MKEQCGKLPKWHCPYCGHRTYRKYNLKLHVAQPSYQRLLASAALSHVTTVGVQIFHHFLDSQPNSIFARFFVLFLHRHWIDFQKP